MTFSSVPPLQQDIGFVHKITDGQIVLSSAFRISGYQGINIGDFSDLSEWVFSLVPPLQKGIQVNIQYLKPIVLFVHIHAFHWIKPIWTSYI